MQSQFTVQHYAGKVRYTVTDFCFKNKDNLFASIVMGIQQTKNKFIASALPDLARLCSAGRCAGATMCADRRVFVCAELYPENISDSTPVLAFLELSR